MGLFRRTGNLFCLTTPRRYINAVGDVFPLIIGGFTLRLAEFLDLRPTVLRIARASGKECEWTSYRSRRGHPGQKALGWEMVRQGKCLSRLQVYARPPLSGTTSPTTFIATAYFLGPICIYMFHRRRRGYTLRSRNMDRLVA